MTISLETQIEQLRAELRNAVDAAERRNALDTRLPLLRQSSRPPVQLVRSYRPAFRSSSMGPSPGSQSGRCSLQAPFPDWQWLLAFSSSSRSWAARPIFRRTREEAFRKPFERFPMPALL